MIEIKVRRNDGNAVYFQKNYHFLCFCSIRSEWVWGTLCKSAQLFLDGGGVGARNGDLLVSAEELKLIAGVAV